jgi:hypothetical protein
MILRVLVSLTHGDELWAQKVLEYEPALGFVLRVILSSDKGINTEALHGGNTKGKEKEGSNQDSAQSIDPSKDDGTSKHADNPVHSLDRLCLALGLLTNLVQTLDSMSDNLRTTRKPPLSQQLARVDSESFHRRFEPLLYP